MAPAIRRPPQLIKDALKQDEVLSAATIEVSTDQGVVTLSGAVRVDRRFPSRRR